MKIVVHSPNFYPLLGGLERVAEILSAEFVRQGHEVTVISNTPPGGSRILPFPVVRNSSWRDFVDFIRRSDIFLQFNISLKGLPALMASRKPWIVSHQTWLTNPDGSSSAAGLIKQLACRFASNIACSQAVAHQLSAASHVIANPYDASVFKLDTDGQRPGELLFVGRLVSDKGTSGILNALHLLGKAGLKPCLTIIGDGPERPLLQAQTTRLALDAQVKFLGPLEPESVAREMSSHQVLIVPSVWQEPFGIVALEGLACGCRAVVAKSGGLPEAAGPDALVFERGNISDLARCLALAVQEKQHLLCSPQTQDHLARHHASRVAAAYLEFMTRRIATCSRFA